MVGGTKDNKSLNDRKRGDGEIKIQCKCWNESIVHCLMSVQRPVKCYTMYIL